MHDKESAVSCLLHRVSYYHCEGDSPKQSQRFRLLRCRSQWQLSCYVHYKSPPPFYAHKLCILVFFVFHFAAVCLEQNRPDTLRQFG